MTPPHATGSRVRDEAVRRVDARLGYTVEHSASPEMHRAMYDDEEQAIRAEHATPDRTAIPAAARLNEIMAGEKRMAAVMASGAGPRQICGYCGRSHTPLWHADDALYQEVTEGVISCVECFDALAARKLGILLIWRPVRDADSLDANGDWAW